MKFCPKCNQEYDDELMFCFECGERLQKEQEIIKPEVVEQKFCPFCGQTIDGDSDYCPFCGKHIINKKQIVNLPKTIVSNKSTIQIKKNNNNVSQNLKNQDTESKDDSNVVSWIKCIFSIIGMLLAFIIFKLSVKGGVKILRNDGFSLGFVIVFIIGFLALWFVFRNDE